MELPIGRHDHLAVRTTDFCPYYNLFVILCFAVSYRKIIVVGQN